MKYIDVKIKDFRNVHETIEIYEGKGYKFVCFFYESDIYGLFKTYLLFKEKKDE